MLRKSEPALIVVEELYAPGVWVGSIYARKQTPPTPARARDGEVLQILVRPQTPSPSTRETRSRTADESSVSCFVIALSRAQITAALRRFTPIFRKSDAK